MRGRFFNRESAFKIRKPVWACLQCGWFTQEGKTPECKECSNQALDHFDSEGEYYEYKRLRLMEKCGEITDLERQVRYDFFAFNKLNQKPVLIFFYKADFVYKNKEGDVVVRDYKPEVKKTDKDPKGERALSPEFKLKRRAMKLVYNIEVQI